MKVKNLNNSAAKTKLLIRRIFAELISEHRELNKVSVSELCRRANISRTTFYSHYEDVYAVAEDYETELIDKFFTNEKLSRLHDIKKFIDELFEYIYENQDTYVLIAQGNSFSNAAGRISNLGKCKFFEICNTNPKIKNKEFLETELAVMCDGILCQFMRLCRGASGISLETLHSFCLTWAEDFINRRSI